MIRIENRQKSPVQLVVKSKDRPHSMCTVNIPGLGSGHNVYYLEDELTTQYVERAEKNFGQIKTRYIPNREYKKIKGE